MMPSGGGMEAGEGMIKTLLLNEKQFTKITEYSGMHRLSLDKNS